MKVFNASLLKKTLLIVFAAIALSSVSQAAIIVQLQSVSFNAGTNDYTWTYIAALQPDQNMRVTATPPPANTLPQDFFTIFDFQGYVAGSLSVNYLAGALFPGRTFSTQVKNSGDIPPNTAPVDSALYANINVYLSGGGNIVPDPNGSAIDIATVTARSQFGFNGSLTNYAAQAQKKQNLLTTSNIGLVEAPSNPIPEPISMLLVGSGLVAVALQGRRRRK